MLLAVIGHLGDAIHNPIGARLIGEKIVHGSGAATHLPESPSQKIGGPDGLQKLFIKIIGLDVVEQALFRASDGPFLSNKPFGLPCLEKRNGFLTAVQWEDQLSLLAAMISIDLFDLPCHTGHLMSM